MSTSETNVSSTKKEEEEEESEEKPLLCNITLSPEGNWLECNPTQPTVNLHMPNNWSALSLL
ncbi:hypothetical protein CROQUDRAFT_88789 [Cronartium quercuum f. sp. fusiforme G11]|uniref:Uncharacterized protein n=1 Tax=Cronartium quercuum f. sp. fusiforme G11 TaxID=708437 RepID=A0A9P6NST7_9BASI|nr:hypothetical protein CROQUDRAFT_88789 [Cronartium quercuum f. sp. fusiforme G11]